MATRNNNARTTGNRRARPGRGTNRRGARRKGGLQIRYENLSRFVDSRRLRLLQRRIGSYNSWAPELALTHSDEEAKSRLRALVRKKDALQARLSAIRHRIRPARRSKAGGSAGASRHFERITKTPDITFAGQFAAYRVLNISANQQGSGTCPAMQGIAQLAHLVGFQSSITPNDPGVVFADNRTSRFPSVPGQMIYSMTVLSTGEMVRTQPFIEFAVDFPPAQCDSWYVWTTELAIDGSITLDESGGDFVVNFATFVEPDGAFTATNRTVHLNLDGSPDAPPVPLLFDANGSGRIDRAAKIVSGTIDVRAGKSPRIWIGVPMFAMAEQGRTVSFGNVGLFDTYGQGRGVRYYTFPKGGNYGCYISTAICEVLGKPDDCRELSMLRAFRDTWLRSMPGGTDLTRQYYEMAPRLLGKLELRPDRHAILRHLYEAYLSRILVLIEKGRYSSAVRAYVEMTGALKSMLGRSPAT